MHSSLSPTDGDSFLRRHLGPSQPEQLAMLHELSFASLDELINATVPSSIRLSRAMDLPFPATEQEALAELREIAKGNQVAKSYLGMGYHGTFTPPVIQRNIQNPGWYTAYTPYQAEIAQGRLEALLNFQTMIKDLTALDIANASLLDEGTAAAEAVAMAFALRKNGSARTLLVSSGCHPQTIAVVQTRARPVGWKVVVSREEEWSDYEDVFAVLLQYPRTDGAVLDYEGIVEAAHAAAAIAIVAADPLALTLLRPPGEFGADIAVGSTQRFGVPMGYGGPHAAYLATRDAFKRQMPGRLVGVSHDAHGAPAYRLSLQTREQHIRRDKATSNICTAQVLLAVMASMYAVYHGPDGLKRIARRVNAVAESFAACLPSFTTLNGEIFDTVGVEFDSAEAREEVFTRAASKGINLRRYEDPEAPYVLLVSFDETTTEADLRQLVEIFTGQVPEGGVVETTGLAWRDSLVRRSSFLTHPVFNTHHTETEMLRYLRRLEARDLSLTTSMIPLGSCTMKLNATAEMFPVSWPEFAAMHPFAPAEQARGYAELFQQLEAWLAEITGFAAVSLQPNAGSQGEYAGLLAIRAFHESRGRGERNVCLIPQSAHGTNPASAVMAGWKVVPVHCLEDGDIDVDDLRAKAEAHRDDLACLMVTYPSTHGVFEEGIREICELVHGHGGQVYMDGANLNAQVGVCRPGDMGADVCHLNLHKTFCIPHGGGGPGMGPIGVAAHLAEFLPVHPLARKNQAVAGVAVSAAPWGSASILPISWMYIRMMGGAGLTEATRLAILNANYIARRLERFYKVLFKGRNGLVAHECILDLRPWKQKAGIEVEDVAKRLMDYGFHAPTVSWPVPGTMMIEPTESESKAELDRFCEAMIGIHREMLMIERGEADRGNNPLKHAPHTAATLLVEDWDHPYTREEAAFPAPWVREHKFWPTVGRIDSVYGDRNLICSCLPMDEYAAAVAD